MNAIQYEEPGPAQLERDGGTAFEQPESDMADRRQRSEIRLDRECVEGASSRCAYSTGCPSRPGSCRRYRQKVGFDFVVMLGDNVYGGESPEDFRRKFEIPYKPLLEAGVKFYASPGNHDNPNERFYQPYNLNARENCALTT